jgi:poly-gamma-glutamate system protein
MLADPNNTDSFGTQFSPITTDHGDIEAKLTTTDPSFADFL